MRPREIHRYLADLGWRDPCRLTDTESVETPPRPETEPEAPIEQLDLDGLAREFAGCTRCRLCEKRSHVVFGEGHPRARILFVGEGPGAEEDRTGRPFVGQAGQLLDRMIAAMGFDRSEMYIANVVKCRPPGNRDPRDDEIAACSPFLDRQIELIRPDVIIALGRFAASRLTGTKKSMGALRGRWAEYKGVSLLPTFHPAYLLRNPAAKREVWQDLKLVLAKLAQ